MKKITVAYILFLSALSAQAQQVGLFSHYFYKPMVYNPAFAGFEDGTQIMLVHHKQWSGFKGAPQFNILTLDKNVMKKKVGIGLKLMSDTRGINNRAGGDFYYSFRFKIGEDAQLALGMSVGILDQALNFSNVVVENTADPALFPDVQHKISFDGNAGLAFKFKGLDLGIAVPHLFGNKIKYSDAASYASYTHARHYMGSLKYTFMVSKEKGVSIAPQALVRSAASAPLQYDANITLDWKDKFWAGATYKSNYALAANIGLCIFKQFSVGYSYDIITGSIGSYSGLSHEIMLNIKFGNNKKPEPENTKQDTATAMETSDEVVPEKDSLLVPAQREPVVEKPEPAATVKQPFDYAAYQKHKADSLEKIKSASSNNNVWIGTFSAADFRDVQNQIAGKGYYVVAGSFLSRENANAEVKRMISKGFRSSGWVYSQTRKFNYVFIVKTGGEKEAVKQAVHVLSNGAEFEDVWILHLTE